ncbi:hypothetical protein STVA_13510 [Allostella vacuolata]|nr:hypothetical protein STVA_13510 [Stella vacuolata]
MARWLNRTPYPYAEADARGFLLAPPAPFQERWTIADGIGDQLLGMVTLEPCAEGRELGYWLHPDAQGRGAMAEAVSALLAAALRAEPGRTIVATTDIDNLASQAVLARCGFRPVGERTMDRPRRGGMRTILLFQHR